LSYTAQGWSRPSAFFSKIKEDGIGTKTNVCKVLVAKPESTRPLGRPEYKRESNIKMDFEYKEYVCSVT
jgi:hypothetical protein